MNVLPCYGPYNEDCPDKPIKTNRHRWMKCFAWNKFLGGWMRPRKRNAGLVFFANTHTLNGVKQTYISAFDGPVSRRNYRKAYWRLYKFEKDRDQECM